jgi:molybdopterin-binding protein
MLRVEGLAKKYAGFQLRDVSFEIDAGEYFVLLGASGVGKTLVLEMIAGLTTPDAGNVFLDGADITRARIQSRNLALVYQEQALFPHMRVAGNIDYGMRAAGMPRAARAETVARLAREVGVEELLDRYPGTLSGGEAQRASLARALATKPKCLLLDEPLSSLDAHARAELRHLLRTLHRAGQTVLHVTHDFEEAVSLATRVGIIENGSVVQVGTPREVFHHPRSEFVARFTGIRNIFNGRLEQRASPDGLRRFAGEGCKFSVLTDAAEGRGLLVIRSEDITLAREVASSSAQNVFRGRVTEILPARVGMELTVDIGVPLTALVSAESVERLALEVDSEVWAWFKASAARFIEE